MALSINNEYEDTYSGLCKTDFRVSVVSFPLDHRTGAAWWLFGYSVEILSGDVNVYALCISLFGH